MVHIPPAARLAVAFVLINVPISCRSEPYDPYLPRGGSSSNPSGPSNGGGNAKTAAIQAQIDDTVGIMRENITKVAERGERLDSLQDKTGKSAAPLGRCNTSWYAGAVRQMPTASISVGWILNMLFTRR